MAAEVRPGKDFPQSRCCRLARAYLLKSCDFRARAAEEEYLYIRLLSLEVAPFAPELRRSVSRTTCVLHFLANAHGAAAREWRHSQDKQAIAERSFCAGSVRPAPQRERHTRTKSAKEFILPRSVLLTFFPFTQTMQRT